MTDSRDVQQAGKTRPAHPEAHQAERRGRKRFNFALQNLQTLREARRTLPSAQARRLWDYLIDVLAEDMDPVRWRALVREARRRVALYFPEE